MFLICNVSMRTIRIAEDLVRSLVDSHSPIQGQIIYTQELWPWVGNYTQCLQELLFVYNANMNNCNTQSFSLKTCNCV